MHSTPSLLARAALAGATALLALLPPCAAARDVVVSVHPVVQLQQADGESGDEFVARAARSMRDYTARTGFEAGGWLCTHPATGKGAMTVISDHSQIRVSAGIKGCPLGGYRPTAEFMHSHPVKESIVLTEHDLHGYPVGRMARMFMGMQAGATVRVGESGGRFSAADLAIGPGYLVHGDNLYHQAGGRQRLVRSLLQGEAHARLAEGEATPRAP